jgi:polyisoprenoid-binding protein YceI
MKRSIAKSHSSVAIAVAICLASALALAEGLRSQRAVLAASPQIVLTLDPAQSSVHWNVDSTLHTVHGTFTLTRGLVRFDPATGKADGEIVVSARSGQTDNTSRDARMHKEILETDKYVDAIFRPTQVKGTVSRSGASNVTLHGIFTLHGSDHDLDAIVHIEMSPDSWKATCSFQVPYIAWGIKDPSNFLLKVKPVVNVGMETAGVIQRAE